MIYPALKLALENGALELIPYVKSIFKEWKGQGIRHLSDLGIASLTTRDQENEIISVYLDELARRGGQAKVEGNTAIITGVETLTGARVSAPDLRAGAALVIAGLAAEGITIVDDIRYIQRGYESFDEKLRGLGAEIRQVDSAREAQKYSWRVS